ncbi:MAG: triose-phosphate isomerase [Epulopiscium sp.]|nr:triose-phosphate isomerase [Candidatus Epulonipiscium sp.]
MDTMKKLLLGTNWKMHKTEEEALSYTSSLIELTKELKEFQIFIIPPYTDLKAVKKLVKNSEILLGAQNMHWEEEGAFTGEISPKMLKEIGIDIIEIGHSERRQYYNETDYTVNKKVLSALKYGFIPLICVGEKIEEKEYGVTSEVIARQIKIALHNVSEEDAKKVWIAYEPVWAIGENGIPASPDYAGRVHTLIYNVLREMYNDEIVKGIPILYGGSVNHDNAVPLYHQPHIDGLFIGRSAWDAKSFRKIMDLILESRSKENKE